MTIRSGKSNYFWRDDQVFNKDFLDGGFHLSQIKFGERVLSRLVELKFSSIMSRFLGSLVPANHAAWGPWLRTFANSILAVKCSVEQSLHVFGVWSGYPGIYLVLFQFWDLRMRVRSMRLVQLVCALKQTMLVILNFHLNEGSFFFVGIRVIEVDPLVYSLNANMILNQFSEAG